MSALLAALISVSAAPSIAPEAQKPVEDLFAKMRKAYSAVESAEFQIKLKATPPEGVRTGIVSVKYQKPNKIRYVGEFGSQRVERYSDGKSVINIVGSNRTTAKVDVDSLGQQAFGNLEWLCFFDWKRQLSTDVPQKEKGQPHGNTMGFSTFKLIPKEEWNGRSWIVLEETASYQNVTVRYFVDPKTYLIWRCDNHFLKPDRPGIHTEITQLKLGVKFDPKTFQAPKA